MNSALLYAIILIEGYVSVGVEILMMRQLMPFVGSSVVVNSLIIGVFLLFLAIGYYRGGKREGDYVRILWRNFVVAMLFMVVGLSYAILEWAFEAFVARWDRPLLFLVGYLLLVTAPLIYLLGQTVPITTNLFRAGGVSEISGTAMFLSTVGSFLGAVLTSVLLMNTIGVAATVMLTIAMLAALTLAMSPGIRALVVRALVLAPMMAGAWALTIRSENYNFFHTNEYSGYQVFADEDQNRYLAINRNWSSQIGPDGVSSFWYIERIRDLIAEEMGGDLDVLVLGAGGFTLSLSDSQGSRYTYVDIDPAIQEVVTRYYNEAAAGDFFVAKDARVFLRRSGAAYDVVLSDVYTNRYALPQHLTTVEYVSAVRDALRENGVAVFNIIMRPDMGDSFSRNTDATIRVVFPHCLSIPEEYGINKRSNVLYVCRKDTGTGQAYTDDINRVGMDSLMNLK